jgi:hypothetical protein
MVVVLHPTRALSCKVAAPDKELNAPLVRRCASLSGAAERTSLRLARLLSTCSRLRSGCPPTVAVVELAPFLVDQHRDGFQK